MDGFDDDVPMSQAQSDGILETQRDQGLVASTSGRQAEDASTGGVSRRERKGKKFNDPVYHYARLCAASVSLIDSIAFQRLRDLKQLGLSYWVFPGASHNRFEHSLGVAHLGQKWARQFYKTQKLDLDMTAADVKAVEIAGLCHDLGHGPLSHVFDQEFLHRCGINDWHHEDMSCQILDHIRDEEHIDDDVLTDDEATLIKALIDKDKRGAGQANDKLWMYDIVANERNGIDVDKFDYLQRDSRNCGVGISCDFKRLMLFSMVRDDQIVFKNSEAIVIRELYHSREIMHRQVYTHRKVKSLDFMAVDAMMLANEALHLTDRIRSAAEFVTLDDTLFKTIENYDTFMPALADDGADGKMREAQALIKQIRTRQLYRFVNEVIVPPGVLVGPQSDWKTPTAADIVKHYSKSEGVTLRLEDVIVHENKIDFTMKDGNPLDYVRFFHKETDRSSHAINKATMSSMMPEAFQERAVRVYSRNRDQRVVDALDEAFDKWQAWRFKGQAVPRTPAKLQAGQPGGSSQQAGQGGGGGGQLPPLPPGTGHRGGGGDSQTSAKRRRGLNMDDPADSSQPSQQGPQ